MLTMCLSISLPVMQDTCLPGSPAGPLRPGGPCLLSPKQELQQHLNNH